MDSESYLSAALIPLMAVVILAYYAVRLLVLHDIAAVRGKNKTKKVKNEEMYAKEAGKLMLFLAAASLVMAVILYWSTIAALIEICVCVVIFGILWKRMDEKYGG